MDVAAHERKAIIAKMVGEVPLAAGRHIVKNRDALNVPIGEQTIHEMAANEPRPTSDEARYGHGWHS
jgi:hypothetical protein